MANTDSDPRVRVGLLGAGSVTQVIHLPVFALLSHLFSVETIYDISQASAEHCATKFRIPQVARSPEDVLTHPSVDVVFVLTADEYHEEYTVSALRNGKHVFVEKPMTISLPSAERIIEAEKASNGRRVFVGYMRRYAASFTQAFKREIASIPRIMYARVRDFSGPNDMFVSQSGTFPRQFTDFPVGSGEARATKAQSLVQEAFEGRQVTPDRRDLCRFLGTLGSHDISLMRETIGLPESVEGVTANDPFYSAILNFRNTSGEPFAVTYESGIDGVPVFDAHFAVYGSNKRVSIEYPSPFVKGLPIKVKVDEVNESGDVQSREVLSSYEDNYTAELQELWQFVVHGKPFKTTAVDALQDLQIYDMIYRKYDESRPL